jgi:3-hydroxybutyryl-CoA dehydratase
LARVLRRPLEDKQCSTDVRKREARVRREAMPFPGERFTSDVALSPSTVAAFALLSGDTNPVHRDPAFARSTRFGRPIASGTHTTALLLGLTASHFSKDGAMLGLEFWVRFRRVVYADERIRVEWLVVRVKHNERLGGDVVDLRGRIKGQDGITAVGAKGRVLVTSQL